MRMFDKVFLWGVTSMLSLTRDALATLHESNSLQQSESALLDSRRCCSFYVHSSGVPVALIGQEGIRCAAPFQRQGKSGAAPATVGGESFSHVPLDLGIQGLGRRRRVTTREPGDLPERGHPSDVRWARAGRTSAAVTSTMCHTRMEAATAMLAHIPSIKIVRNAISAALAASKVLCLTCVALITTTSR
jgi:hypothetical protein